MSVKKYNATAIDNAVAMGNAVILDEIFNNIEEDMKNGNSIALVHETVSGEEFPTQVFHTLEDLHDYRRRVIKKPLSWFEKKIRFRTYQFKRAPMLLDTYEITTYYRGNPLNFRMEKRGDDRGFWEICAQVLPADVYEAGLAFHDSIEANENGE